MKQKTKKFGAATLLLEILMGIALSTALNGLAIAADPPASTTPSTPANSIPESFSVKKYLTVSGQNQTYLQSTNPIASFIIQAINFLVLTIGSFSFLALIIGGFMLMTSHGSENQRTKGKDVIKYALTGLVVVLMAYFITAFVQSLFYELPGQ